MLPARFLDIAASAALRVFGGDAVAAAEFLAGERKRKPGANVFVEFLEGYYRINDPISVEPREMGIYVEAMELRGDDIDLTLQQAQKILGFEAEAKDGIIDALLEYSYRKRILDAYKVFLAEKTKSEFKKFIAALVAKRKEGSQVSSQNEDEESYVDGLVTDARKMAKTGFFLKIEPRGARKIHAAIAVVFGTRLSKVMTEKNVAIYAQVAEDYEIDGDSEDDEFLDARPPATRPRTSDEIVNTSNIKPASEESSDASTSGTEEFSHFSEEPGYRLHQSQEEAQLEDGDSPLPDPQGDLSWGELEIAAEKLGNNFVLPKTALPLGVDRSEFERVRTARDANLFPLEYDHSELSTDLKTFLSDIVRDRAIEFFKNDPDNWPDLTTFRSKLNLNRGWPAPEWITSGYNAYVDPLLGDKVPPSSQGGANELFSPLSMTESEGEGDAASMPDSSDSSSVDIDALEADVNTRRFPPAKQPKEPLRDAKRIEYQVCPPPARQATPQSSPGSGTNEIDEIINARLGTVPLRGEVPANEAPKVPGAADKFNHVHRPQYLPYVLMLKREDANKFKGISQNGEEQLNKVAKVLDDAAITRPSPDTFVKWKRENLNDVNLPVPALNMRAVFSLLRRGGDYNDEIAHAVAEMIAPEKMREVYQQIVADEGDAVSSAPNFDDYTGSLDPIAQGIVEAYGDRHPDTLKPEFTAVRRVLKEIRAVEEKKVKGARNRSKNTEASKHREPAKPTDKTGGEEVIEMSVTATALRYLKLLGYSSVPRTGRTNFALADAAGLTNAQIGTILGNITIGALKGKRDQARAQTPDDWKKLKLPSPAERIRVFNQYLYPKIGKKRGAFFRFAIWKAIQNANITDAADVFERATGKKPALEELNLIDPEIGEVPFSQNGKLAVAFAANVVDAVLDEMEQARAAKEAARINIDAALVLSRGNEALAARLLARMG